MKLNESQKIMKYLNESSNSIDKIISKLHSGEDTYVMLNSFDEGLSTNVFKIDYSQDNERPEDYDEGYTSGWDRGQDEEFDKKQDEKFARATKAFEDGEVFELNAVVSKNGKIEYTGECLLKAYGEDELIDNLEYFKATPLKVKTYVSFEGDEE